MRNIITTLLLLALALPGTFAQGRRETGPDSAPKDSVVEAILQEENNHSQLRLLAHQLFDSIGPRLVGTPQMDAARDWALAKYKSWSIPAEAQNWGVWRGWERGISHIDMISPRVRTLEATQLAWCPSMGNKTVTAGLVILPDLADSAAYAAWMPSVKGKFVMVSMLQPTGRPDDNWDQFGTPQSIQKMKDQRKEITDNWNARIKKSGYTTRTLPVALEKAGAVGIVSSYWSAGFGVDKIFGAYTKTTPSIDIMQEDYGLLYRLVESGADPKISVHVESKERGVVPTFNVVAGIRGTEKPNEYVMLSAHFDSWDGGSGATDNGTGTLMMMEAMRILQKVYPHPKRTILVGHWGSEEEGLNGSRAFVEDHPDTVSHLQALFNQDNGTGRVINTSGQGYLHAYEYLTRWLSKVPSNIRDSVKTTFPGMPGGGGSDFASFDAVGAPGFSLGALNWSYFNYTWHTNRDTYDKLVFDDLSNNVMLVAILAYMASEDPNRASIEKAVLPIDPRTGERVKWPIQVKAIRRGGLD
ncbi:peptidase M28 [Russula earlei]|uniref:Peptidase M28 n=1 Tax=Russula earlei TaxID=71964 RepID=A0ACC0TTF2_9AGAM|nr:peptidase M28 [Russula earlei]